MTGQFWTAADFEKAMCLTGTPFANRYKNRFCIQKSFRISAERVLGIPFAAGKMLLLSVRHFYKNRFSLKFTIRSKKKRKAGFILLSVFLYLCNLSALLPQLWIARKWHTWLECLSSTGTGTDSIYRSLSAYLWNVFLVFHLQPERGCCYQSGILQKQILP